MPPKSPGVDDLTGEPLSQRQDDLLDSFKSRMKSYTDHLDSIKAFYHQKGILHTFSGSRTKEIYAKIIHQMQAKSPAFLSTNNDQKLAFNQ